MPGRVPRRAGCAITDGVIRTELLIVVNQVDTHFRANEDVAGSQKFDTPAEVPIKVADPLKILASVDAAGRTRVVMGVLCADARDQFAINAGR